MDLLWSVEENSSFPQTKQPSHTHTLLNCPISTREVSQTMNLSLKVALLLSALLGSSAEHSSDHVDSLNAKSHRELQGPPPGFTEYIFYLDCSFSPDAGLEKTKTTNTIEVKFFDASNNFLAANYFQGLNCQEGGESVSIFAGPNTAPASIRVEIFGSDATLINKAWVSRSGNQADPDKEWGIDNDEGWCMSEKDKDGQDNDWEGNIVEIDGDDKCKYCIIFGTTVENCEDLKDFKKIET